MASDQYSVSKIDSSVGARLRLARRFAHVSQKELGEKIDCSFQQIQKFECGQIRISAGRLFILAQILNVPVDYFFSDFQPVDQKRYLDLLNNVANLFTLNSVKSECAQLISTLDETDAAIVREILLRFRPDANHSTYNKNKQNNVVHK